MIRIVPVASVTETARLEPLARRIFGERDRPAGWFSRKLHRECVDAALSQLAIEGEETDPRAWCGYALVGTPPSYSAEGAARTSGIGVVPSHRGRGLGRRLVEAALLATRERGFERLRIPSAVEAADFYRRLDFSPYREEVTCWSLPRGGPGLPWGSLRRAPPPDHTVAFTWLVEAWTRTEIGLRTTVDRSDVHLRLSLEGRARLVHAAFVASGTTTTRIARALDELRHQVGPGGPLLAAGLPAHSPIHDALVRAGWAEAQRSHLLQRKTGPLR